MATATPATIPRLRERFSGLDRKTWLVSHSMGAPPLAARAALEGYWNEWAALTTKIVDATLERGLPTNTPLDPRRRTGWIGIDVPDGARIVEALIARRILVDYRPRCGIRVSAHFYTTDAEVDHFFGELDALRN